MWTGDSARHDNDEKIPRTPAQVLDSNRMVAQKFLDVFSDPSNRSLMVPVIPTLGNNDILPHNVLLPGPNRWLSYYGDIWRRFIPEEQRHSFEFGGWFYVEVIPGRLAVFSLNTLYFFDRNAGIDDCVAPSEPGFKQMEWLRIQLQFLRERGMKAILMGHVPPARTGSKQLWDETCWHKYVLWLRQYRDVVVSGVFGHMNIDHFLLHDTHDVDGLLAGVVDPAVRTSMEDELSVETSTDYLQELRAGWTKLSRPRLFEADDEDAADEIHGDEEEDPEEEDSVGGGSKRRKKHKKHKKKPKKGKPRRKWGERYQVSLVSPSVVPNYFPTLRVVEYNISGLEDTPTWVDSPPTLDLSDRPHRTALRPDDISRREGQSLESEAEAARRKKKHKKPKKPKKPKDPNLVVPPPPSPLAPPGPAYSPQPLTILGYTQYFANLTHINREPSGSAKSKPRLRPFKYEVEYRTFDDKKYNLTDLTVNSYLELAYRMGQKSARRANGIEETKKKKKKKKNKKKQKHNEVWLHFLRHAFVRTVSRDELEELDS